MANPAGSKLATAFIEVTAGFGDFGKALEQGVGNAITSTGAALGAAMEGLGKELFKKFTIPFGIAAAANIAQWAQLERAIGETLTLFGTAPVLVDETFDSMSAGITRVSEQVGGLERDIADGLYQTISAGVPRGNAFDFLEVAQLAATADKTADLTTAVDGITTAINAFGLEFTDAGTVADQFFATVARGKTTFGELSQALGRVAPLAANAGTSLQETLAIVGQLTTSGLQTSEAVSFLRAAITGLLRPTDELNEIFERAGHASAEAAIPVIGLQAAFQKVVDAAGGSTSKLQELIGTSEGVSAILGVTGENAEKFASVMNSVENSAGAAQNAFDIIDGTVSRSFGKLTEAFDRMGNLFGSFGAQFAQPVVDMFTDIINTVTSNFRKLTPIIANFARVFENVLKVFDNVVFKQVAGALASIAIAFGAILAIAGALIAPLGILIGLFFKIKAVQTIIGALSGTFATLQVKMLILGDSLRVLGAKMAASATSMSAFGRIVQALGITMQTTLGSFAVALGTIALIVAAVAGAIYIWSRWQDAIREAYEAEQTFTLGIERLAVAVGATTHALTFGQQAVDGYQTSLEEFLVTNGDLVGKLQETQLELGNLAAKRFLISVAADLQLKGASAEEALEAVRLLLEGAGLDIPITFDEIESSANFSALMDSFSDQVDVWNSEIDTRIDAFGGTIGAQIDNTVAQLTDSFAAAAKSGDVDAFFQSLNQDIAGVDNIFLANELVKELALSLEEASGRDYNLSIDDLMGTTDPVAELVRQLELADAITPEVVETLNELANIEPVEIFKGDITGGLPSDIEEFGIAFTERMPGIIELTDTQLGQLHDLRGEIDSILDAGTQYIEDHFNTMNEQISGQMPLLDIYEGAIDQSFAKWKKGQEQFVEDLAAVDVAREKLVNNFGEGSALVDAFDATPLDKQAWLAALNPKEFQEAMDLLVASEDAVGESVANRMAQDQEEIMTGVQNAMNERYQELYDEAVAAGAGVATLWQINFERVSKTWVTTAETVMGQISDIVSVEIPGPTVGPLSVGPLPNVGPYSQDSTGGGANPVVNLTVNNPQVTNLTGDTQRAVGILQTSQHLRT